MESGQWFRLYFFTSVPTTFFIIADCNLIKDSF